MSNYKFSLVKNVYDKEPTTESLDWNELCELFSGQSKTTFHRSVKLKYPAIIAGSINGRENESVDSHSFLAADIDTDPTDSKYITFEDMCNKLLADGLAFIGYTTTKNCRTHNRYRLILPYSSPVPNELCKAAWQACNDKLGGIIDPSTKNESRLSFMPAQWAGNPFWDRGEEVCLNDPFNAFRKGDGAPFLTDDDIQQLKASSVKPACVPQKAIAGNDNRWAMAALEYETSAVSSAPKGQRNNQLNKAAYAIAQIVAGGSLDEYEARVSLEGAASMCGLGNSEARTTINSAWEAGAREPRCAPVDAFHGESAEPSRVDPLGEMVCAADVAGQVIDEREWLWEGWLPVGAATGLFGDGGLGKSLIAKQIATAIASGTPLFGEKTTKSKVLAFYCEDDENELARRQKSVCTVSNIKYEDISGYCYQSRFGKESLLGHIKKGTGEFVTNTLFDSIRNRALQTRSRLVILDNALHLFGDNLNDPGAVTRFMAALNRLALDINGAVLLLGHIAKAEGSQFAGTAAWSNASRNRLFLGRPTAAIAARNPDSRVLVRSKSNYARSGDELTIMWHHGAYLRPEDMPDSSGANLEDAIDNRHFLDLLDKFTKQQQTLSIHPKARNYAPSLMSKDGKYQHTETKRRMEKAMGRLLTAGTIVEEAALGFKKEDRKEAYGIKRVAVQSAVQCGSDTENTQEMAENLAVQCAAQMCGSDAVQCGSDEENGGKPCGSHAVLSAVHIPHTPTGYVSPPMGGGLPSPTSHIETNGWNSRNMSQSTRNILERLQNRGV